MSTKSVLKLDLLTRLWNDGFNPQKKWTSAYDSAARKIIFQMLGIQEEQCSNSTIDNIVDEVSKFQKSVVYYWKSVGAKRDAMEKKDFFKGKITIEVIPVLRELAPPPQVHRPSGGYKSFEEKKRSGQASDIAAVAEHPPGAILKAAPRAASDLGFPQFATAIRKMATDPEVLPALAMEGMTRKRMHYYFLLDTFKYASSLFICCFFV